MTLRVKNTNFATTAEFNRSPANSAIKTPSPADTLFAGGPSSQTPKPATLAYANTSQNKMDAVISMLKTKLAKGNFTTAVINYNKLDQKQALDDLHRLAPQINTPDIIVKLDAYQIIEKLSAYKMSFIFKLNFLLALDGLNAEEIAELLQKACLLFENKPETLIRIIGAAHPINPSLRSDFLTSLKDFFEQNHLMQLNYCCVPFYLPNYLNTLMMPNSKRQQAIAVLNDFLFKQKYNLIKINPESLNLLFSAFALFRDYFKCLNFYAELKSTRLVSNYKFLERLLYDLNVYRMRNNSTVDRLIFNHLFSCKQRFTQYKLVGEIIQRFKDQISNWENSHIIIQAKILIVLINHPKAAVAKSKEIKNIVDYFDQNYLNALNTEDVQTEALNSSSVAAADNSTGKRKYSTSQQPKSCPLDLPEVNPSQASKRKTVADVDTLDVDQHLLDVNTRDFDQYLLDVNNDFDQYLLDVNSIP